jgi:uncharacterized protein (TIGR02246 family)
MKIPVSLALVAVLAAMLSLGSRSAGSQSASHEETQAIRQVIDAYMVSFNRHDAHAVAALFASDGDFTNALQVTTHGQKDIEEHLGPVFATHLKNAQRTSSVRRIQFLKSDVAVATTDYRLEGLTEPNGGAKAARTGLLTWVITKAKDKWLINTLEEAEVPSPCATSNP